MYIRHPNKILLCPLLLVAYFARRGAKARGTGSIQVARRVPSIIRCQRPDLVFLASAILIVIERPHPPLVSLHTGTGRHSG